MDPLAVIIIVSGRLTEPCWVLELPLVAAALLAALERRLLLPCQLLEQALVHRIEALHREAQSGVPGARRASCTSQAHCRCGVQWLKCKTLQLDGEEPVLTVPQTRLQA